VRVRKVDRDVLAGALVPLLDWPRLDPIFASVAQLGDSADLACRAAERPGSALIGQLGRRQSAS
jgi:hypothetical protein